MGTVGDIIDWIKNAISNSPEFKQMLRRAPNKNVGIFKGVYNEETDEIEHSEFVGADAVDSQTKNVMQNEPLVVLS